MKNILLFLIILTSGFVLIINGYSQEKSQYKSIVENVEINWWQVPIFALDKEGNPVTDLNETDIEVWINNRRIEDFTFYKRSFTASVESGSAAEPLPVKKKKNTIFLLFDVAMSTQTCTKHSKSIARQIISGSGPGIQFIVFTIEPFKGLTYIWGPGENKKELISEIKKNVKGKPNERIVDIRKFYDIKALYNNKSSGFPDRHQRIAFRNKDLMRVAASEYYLRKATSFFDSFETLYLIFNSIQNNKFVYFFTEGISRSVRGTLMGGNSLYKYHLEKTAKYLGQSGAVLFILNPMGVHDSTTLITDQKKLFHYKGDPLQGQPNDEDQDVGSPTSSLSKEEFRSGEQSLKYLAVESGGKYLEGNNQAIVKTLEHMHRAYYEISFPDIPGLKGITRRITIKPKRNRISIHSLRSLERNKRYKEMNHMEKEILAVNLVTENPLMKTLVSSQHARITQIKENKKKVIHTVVLPENFLNQQLDLYKLWIKDNLEVVRIKTEVLVPEKKKIKIQFDKRGKTAPACKPYFVLVNGKAESVLVRVIGDEWLDEEEPQVAVKPLKKEFISTEKLQTILDNAAIYCEKLKNSAFHFFCKEKIIESRSPLYASVINSDAVIRASKDFSLMQYDINELTTVNMYVFSYRLLKSGSKIKEEREWLSSKDNTPISRDKVAKATAFFSRRAVFAPLTLLARERQNRYNFRFIRYEKRKGHNAAVIEVIPKFQEEENSIYGNVWIDLTDYSILKIEADPRSIKGYQSLKEIEKQLHTRLFLSLEIEFDQLHGGIRFPTKTHMLEKYKGGRFVLKYKGSKGWERNRTTFTYNDYQFFDVKTEVTIDNN